jgi:hypothetical protein
MGIFTSLALRQGQPSKEASWLKVYNSWQGRNVLLWRRKVVDGSAIIHPLWYVCVHVMKHQSDHPDYYTLLGVSADAAPATIKAAFKRLALRYHPDVYHGADAEEQMRQLLLAYHTLIDPAQRRAYDAQRAGAQLPGEEWQPRPAPQTHRAPRVTAEVSPRARRDRQRHYDFPQLGADAPVRVVLGAVSYDLSADQARTLQQQGVLRGTEKAALGTLPPEARQNVPHTCHRCHHRWIPARVDASHPRLWELICPACKANDWDQYLLLRCVHCQAVFESEQIRDPLAPAGGRLYFPYELFPLCPFCGLSRWCPAEDARVEALRRQDARRRSSSRNRP